MANAQISDVKYEIRIGPLAETYSLFAKGTHNTGAQISADRVTDKGLRKDWYYVSNVPFATKRKGKLLLGISLTPSAFDVVYGRNTENVCQNLKDRGYVHLNDVQKNYVLSLERRGEVVFVDPKEMRLKGSQDEYRSFPIRTDKFEKDITISRMPWVSAGYGSGYMLGKVMDNLRTNGEISETTVFTMNPEHVAENVVDDKIVARASGLDYFGGSSFGAGIRGVSSHGALRGVLLDESAEGGDVQNSQLEQLAEDLAEKCAVAGNEIAVLKKGDVSQETWQWVTKKQ